MATEGIRDIHKYMAGLVTGAEDFSHILKPVRSAVKECAFRSVAPLVPPRYGTHDEAIECFYERFKAMVLTLHKDAFTGVVSPHCLDDNKQRIKAVLEFLVYKDHGWLTYPDENEFKHGIYDHFKGGVYLTSKLGLFSNGETFVDYVSLSTGKSCGRFLWEWCEIVAWPDGKLRSRFVYRGKDLTVPEPEFKVPS